MLSPFRDPWSVVALSGIRQKTVDGAHADSPLLDRISSGIVGHFQLTIANPFSDRNKVSQNEVRMVPNTEE